MRDSTRICAFLLLSILALLSPVCARKTTYTRDVDAADTAPALEVNGTPALYSGDFADCLGGQSLFNVTKFDAAYYPNIKAMVFHIDGMTNIKNESLMSECRSDPFHAPTPS
jgi:hypothetical protein